MVNAIVKKYSDGERIKLSKGIYVDIYTFSDIFKGAKTYDDFINIDGGIKGYKPFFDILKEQGILN